MFDTVFFIIIAVIFIILTFSILKGPTLWDRVLSSNLCCSITAISILLFAIVTGVEYYVDVALVFVLVGFVGTQFYSVFVSRFGKL